MSDYDKQIAEIYREMELELIRNMKRNLGLHLAEEKEVGVKYPQWQAIKLKEMKRYERQNLDIIRRSTARIPKDVSAHMQDEFRQGSSHEIKKYKKVNKALGISSEPVKDSFFRTDARKVTAMIDDVNNSLRTANTAVFRMTNDAYREVVFKYSMFVSNGVYTEKQAYDAAIKDFLDRGINCIEYKDGRRVNIADYAQMAVRTANQRAYMTGQGEFRKKLGRTLIRISQHSTSCELCRPFERQVLIDDVFSGGTQADGDYMLLSEAMAKGLYHPRCRHGSATYFPELDDKIEEKPIKDNSAAKAEKAQAENMVQKYKRLSEGSLCPENVERYQAKLEEWTEKAENISKAVENSDKSDIIETYRNSNNDIKIIVDDEIPSNVIESVENALKCVTKDFKILKKYTEPVEFDFLSAALAMNKYDTLTGRNTIYLEKSVFVDYDKIMRRLKNDYARGLSYKTNAVESLIAHEMGHNAHIALALKRSGLEYAKPLSLLDCEIFKKHYHEICLDVYRCAFSNEAAFEIQGMCVSQLGSMTYNAPSELIAQSFGNYYYGEEKSDIAKSIVEYFKKELKK